MTSPQPPSIPAQGSATVNPVRAATVPAAAPTPAPHTALIDRVTSLEDKLTWLTALHNKFADDVARELGL